ncbi:methyltransferase domain-containing protein [Candidatus Pelagibacter sp.]|nr:methyltransferase domain-containing protein [Candidatus Pelagibacter sp.]
MRIKRLHDTFYKNEKRFSNPKLSFIELLKILKAKPLDSILDVGCANGELLYNLKKKYKVNKLTGFEVLPSLIKAAKRNLPKSINIHKVDITKKINTYEKFDIIIISGVISIFDDYKKPMRALLKILKPKGKIFIFNHFNKYNIDVFIKYRTRSKNDNILQSGWNIHSIKGLEDFFNKNGKKTKVYKFKPKKSFKGKSNDSLRSWTFKNKNNENLITNGLSILQDQYWLKFY